MSSPPPHHPQATSSSLEWTAGTIVEDSDDDDDKEDGDLTHYGEQEWAARSSIGYGNRPLSRLIGFPGVILQLATSQ